VTLFTLPLSCPTCASDVSLVNAHSSGFLSIAIVECHPCEREWEITSRLVAHGRSRAYVERAKQSGQESKRRHREMVPA
jgi:hypothetical protein